jgi:hypothetical protein
MGTAGAIVYYRMQLVSHQRCAIQGGTEAILRGEGKMVVSDVSTPSNYVDDSELAAICEEDAQTNFHMSAKEFLALWQEGKIENPDRPEVVDLLMLIPGAC